MKGGDNLMNILSNFYTDNATEINIFNVFLDAEKRMFDQMDDYTKQIKHNFLIGGTETYRIIDIQNISVADAVYDIGTLLTMDSVITFLDLSAMSLTERITYWNSLESNDTLKVSALNLAGYYVEFNAATVYPANGFPPVMDFNVVSFDVYRGDTKFQIGVDYDIKNNKLYLLSEECRSLNNKNVAFTLRNIAIDFDTANRYFGANFNLVQYEDFSKDIFNEMMANLIKAALKGPSIAGMKAGIDTITGIDGSGAVFDMYSLDTKRRSMWDNYGLSPFDFIIELPAEYSDSDSLSDLIKRFIDAVKLPETYYGILFSSTDTETYARHIVTNDSYHSFSAEITHTDDYRYRTVEAQTNVLTYLLNDNFTTESVHGFLRYEETQITIIDTTNGNRTLVNL
jgi:hypothetical protein